MNSFLCAIPRVLAGAALVGATAVSFGQAINLIAPLAQGATSGDVGASADESYTWVDSIFANGYSAAQVFSKTLGSFTVPGISPQVQGVTPSGQIFYNDVDASGIGRAMTIQYGAASGVVTAPSDSQYSQFGRVNAAGVATEVSVGSDGTFDPYFYTSGSSTFTHLNLGASLGDLPSAITSSGVGYFSGFNDLGGGNYDYQPVGYNGPSDLSGFILPPLPGFGSAEVNGANGNIVVGSVGTVDSSFGYAPQVASFWIYPHVDQQILPAIFGGAGSSSIAYDVNGDGSVIVGRDGKKGVRWRRGDNGRYTEELLQSLLPPDSNWNLYGASQIAGDPDIYGIGAYNGQLSAYVLATPVPEPCSLLAVGCGFCLVVRRRLKQ